MIFSASSGLRCDTERTKTMAQDPAEQIRLNPVEARQGTTRPKLIYVLVASVILVIIAFFIASMFYRH